MKTHMNTQLTFSCAHLLCLKKFVIKKKSYKNYILYTVIPYEELYF